MRFMAFSCVVLLVGSAFGQSIFDEDYKATPAPAKVQTPRPAVPAHRDEGSAAQPAQTATPPSPSRTAEPAVTESLAEIADRTKNAFARARTLAKEYQRRAAADALEGNAPYQEAKAALDAAKVELERVRGSGTNEERLKANTAFYNADAAEKRLRHSVLAGNSDYRDADALASAMNGIGVESPEETDKREAARKGAVEWAIAHRGFVKGMTYEEACRAARREGRAGEASTRGMIYEWDVIGRSGSHEVVSGEHRNLVNGKIRQDTAAVSEYGVVAVIEAVFVDGQLETYRRRSR